MALQAGTIKGRGKLGDKVGYPHNGKLCWRSLPEEVRRSEATIEASTDFGTASTAGKITRRAVAQGLNIRTDSAHINRLNQALLGVLYASSNERGNRHFEGREMDALAGFQFNEKTGLGNLINFQPKVKQTKDSLRIAIPALTAEDIRHAKNTTHIEIKAIAVNVNFNIGEYQEAITEKVMIDLRKPAEARELILPFEAGDDETIVTLQITAYREEHGRMYKLDNKKYFAADIIDVIPSFQEEEEPNLVHHSRDQKKPLFQLHGDHTCVALQKE